MTAQANRSDARFWANESVNHPNEILANIARAYLEQHSELELCRAVTTACCNNQHRSSGPTVVVPRDVAEYFAQFHSQGAMPPRPNMPDMLPRLKAAIAQPGGPSDSARQEVLIAQVNYEMCKKLTPDYAWRESAADTILKELFARVFPEQHATDESGK